MTIQNDPNNPVRFYKPDYLATSFELFFQSKWTLHSLTWFLKENLSITRFSMQNCNELAQLLVFLYDNRERISSYCEIGIAKCGTFFVVDQFLRAFVKNYRGATAIDPWSIGYKEYGLKEYIEHHPNVCWVNKDLRDTKPDRLYGFVLIDCDHSYDLTKEAYNIYKDCCNFLAFHDVANERYPGVVKLWQELQEKHDSTQTIITNDKKLNSPCGIGIINN